ncbi:NACHT, LRR and PYD domains-containing protein 12 isoform X4 [Silurus meridionalis]|nr:NACHT, LRR and PYD domains-containing protein 12 isoform X4 [Silurus meridionalis]
MSVQRVDSKSRFGFPKVKVFLSLDSILMSGWINTKRFNSSQKRHDPESTAADEFQKKLKFNLMEKFQCLNELMLKQENRTLLNEIYTELYITEGDSGDVNKEHEVKQIEAASRRNPTEDTPIKCSDIFKPLPEQDKTIRRVLTKPLSEQDEEPIRNVLTKGVAGIGKTVSVQKFVLDWAEGKTNQDVHLIFPLPFRELNLMKEQKLSLMELLHVFFKEMKEIDISRLEKVLFIFDGLDECRFPLDFQKTVRVCDVTESAPVHVLLINLIKGNLLPSALIWITSRPAAADQIPSECVHRVTEVRGFNDPQKEEYFRKRISNQNLANKVITHLKSLRSLYIMCHIPVFCWISAAVLERMLGEAESGDIPKTLTQMYTHFLIIQTNIIREKYLQKQESDEEMLLKLGKLAFQQLEKQNLIFYEEDLRECDIDVTEAALYSGVCTQIFREEFGLHQSKVYCFVHLSIQEHLAALYVHLTFMKEQRSVLKQNQVCRTLSDVHRSAVDQALDSQTGHLDLFLRFLLGLSLESNQKLLHSLVTQTGSSSQNKETVQYIKKKISEDLSTEKSINLFHCLNELGDDSLVEEIQQYLKSGAQSELSPSQWSALVFVLLTSAQDLKEFDLNKYFTPDKIRHEILVRVMPVIAASRKAMLCDCGVTDEGCAALASALRSNPSHLRELNLTENNVGDSGVKCLSAVLENPHCKLEILWLERCGVSDEGCAALASALRSNPSHLRELDLSENKLGDSGVKFLSAVLDNPQCKLELLGLYDCGVSDEGCAALASALRSNPSHLRKLYLSVNNVGDSGVKCLSDLKDDERYKLQTLMFHCSRAGQFQCKYTNLVFEMKEKAEVLYSIVSWGSVQLDGMGQMQPAGPLYNINCSEESMCKLHLPHCEINSDKNQTELAVAHFSDGNVEIIQPLKVTETHVIIDIKNLSLYGLLMKILFKNKRIKAQVLLFYKEIPGRTKKKKLHMHLLPQNVPVIETEIFEVDSAPNYHPTFEVILPDEAEKLTLGLLDKHDEEVWASRQVFLTGYKREEANSPQMLKTGKISLNFSTFSCSSTYLYQNIKMFICLSAADFVDKHRDILIQKVSSIMEIADGLLSKQMINDELYSTISAAATSQEKMRILYKKCLSIRGVKEEFYTILKEKHPHLVDELENGSSNA